MRTPKRVRVVKNTHGSEYYDKYINTEANIVSYFKPLGEYQLDITDSNNKIPETTWWEDEVEVIEWEDVSTLGVSDIDVGGGEIDFVYYCKICNGNVDGGDKYCRHCGKELVR